MTPKALMVLLTLLASAAIPTAAGSFDIVSSLRARPDSVLARHPADAEERRMYLERIGDCSFHKGVPEESAVHLAPGWFAHSGRALFHKGKCVAGGEGDQTLLFHRNGRKAQMKELYGGLIANVSFASTDVMRLTIRDDGCCDDESATISIIDVPLTWPVKETTVARILTARFLDLSRLVAQDSARVRIVADSVRLRGAPKDPSPAHSWITDASKREPMPVMAVFPKQARGVALGHTPGEQGDEWVLAVFASDPVRTAPEFHTRVRQDGRDHWVGWVKASELENGP